MACTRNTCQGTCGENFEVARGREDFEVTGRGGCDNQEYNCREDRRVIKHHHIVKHRHDVINEYEVVHQHDHHYYDVVTTREEHQHHDHRNHKPDYCEEGECGCGGTCGE